MNKLILLFLIGAGSGGVMADSNQTIYNTYNDYLSETTHSTVNNDITAALSAADKHQFDWATNKWQASVGIGYSGSEKAVSLGAAKRADTYLISGSAQRASGTKSAGVAVGTRF